MNQYKQKEYEDLKKMNGDIVEITYSNKEGSISKMEDCQSDTGFVSANHFLV